MIASVLIPERWGREREKRRWGEKEREREKEGNKTQRSSQPN